MSYLNFELEHDMSLVATRHLRATALLIAACALVAGFFVVTTAIEAESVGEDSGGVFVPVTPTRIADTPSGLNTSATPIPSGGVRAINVLGVGGIPSTGVGAVVLDVAGRSNAGAAVYAYSDGTTRGGSFLKVDANDGWDSNTVIVKPGTNGKVAFYNSYGNTDINVDVQGYFTSVSGEGSPGGFVPITPSRILSTNAGIGLPNATLKGGTTTLFEVAGVGEIPADATAIFGNVRVYDSNYDGGLKLLASDTPVGTFTSLNFVEDEFNDTGLSIKLGPEGKIKIIMNGSASNTAHLIIDVQGYFTPDPESGGSFTPLTQARIFDSRSTVPVPANGSVEVSVAGHAGVPDDDAVGSVAMSVLALNWNATGSVRIYNADEDPPVSTNLAFTAPYDRDVISTSVVELSDEGNVVVQNLSSGSVDIILDAQGWFSEPQDAAPPQEKADEIAAAEITDLPEFDESFASTFAIVPAQEITGETGSDTDLASVKTALPLLLKADMAIGRMANVDPTTREANVSLAISNGDVSNAVAQIWSSEADLGAIETSITEGLLAAAPDTTYVPYDDNGFTTASWEAVTTDGETAVARLAGRHTYYMTSGWLTSPLGWADGPDALYGVELVKVTEASDPYGGWRLSRIDDLTTSDEGEF